jgi:hypothetical protein
MQINLKVVTMFVVIAALLAFVAYFGRVYEGFTSETPSSSDDPTADTITPGSRAPRVTGAYNHFTKQTTDTLSGTYYSQNPQDGSITVVDQDTLQLTLPNGEVITLTKQQENKEGFTNAAYGTFTVYVASNGARATIVNGSDGNTVIRLRKANGEIVYYTLNGSPSSTDDSTTSGTSGTSSATSGTSTTSGTSATSGTTSTTSGTSATSGTSSTTATTSSLPSNQPSPSSAYSPYPAQTTYNTYSPPNDYTSALPPGIPAAMIPPGQEDLYILKTEVVPPVCPAAICPKCNNGSKYKDSSQCPPCKPCGRCPESPFECKKVPNYNAVNNTTLPVPILSDFSTFGM